MMHQPYKGGTSVILQQDDYTEEKDKRDTEVYLPPVGYVYQRHPRWPNHGELVYGGVFQRSDIEAEQYWDRGAFLAQWDFDYKERRKKEKRHQLDDPEYLDHELEDFREAMWKCRFNGMWFMNNGTPVYLTGLNFFYLVCWKLDVGFPKFRMPDWEWFTFWQYCVDDPPCMGDCEGTRRRNGKTMRAGSMLYEYASSHRESHCGIQSKSGTDAKDNVYTKGILNKLKHLWDFFIPKYDLEKGKYPKSGLFFTETNVRGKASLEEIQSSELGELMSSLTWKPADNIAYDGEKQHRYVGDEVGKTEKPVDVYRRHLVIYFCLLDEEYRVIGKAHYTTTVEEMLAGGLEFRMLWDASNQAKRDENGMTSSGLYRYFSPADKTLFIDKYGMPDEDKARRVIMNKRKKLEEEGDYIGLASYIRKNPLNVREMFYVDPNECEFDTIRLNNRLEQLSWMNHKDLYHIGNLSWVDGPDSEVKFTPHPQGKWWIRKDYDPNDPSLWNFTTKEGGIKKPNGNRMAGIDPFSHDKTKDKRRSDGACYVGTLPNATDSSISNVPIVEYIARPKTASLFYEDMTMTLFWTGAEATIEDNKIGLINHLKERDYVGFIKEFDGKPGISASTSTHPHVMAELEEFVSGKENDLFKCTFVRLLSDLFSFDITDTEKNDASMAFAYYRIGCFAYKYKKKPSKSLSLSNNLVDVSEIFPN